mmetsp:Transcript_14964/g.32223  ORF Transcript_14964/g.32223 Transcript_14964/m.32223 type:complete len:489 (-) Transcript_14964:390-1856(-)
MNADLLAMLSGGGLGGAAGGGGGMGGDSSSPNGGSGIELLKFKAGRMKAELQQNGKFLISPDPRRGEIRMLWKSNRPGAGASSALASSSSSGGPTNANGGVLTFEWVDRRTTLPVTTLTIFPEDGCTFQRVYTGGAAGDDNDRRSSTDRVYVLQYGNSSERRFFFWMQEMTDFRDGLYVRDINAYCGSPEECARKAREIGGVTGDGGDVGGAGADGTGAGAVGTADLTAIMQGLTGGAGAGGAAASGGAGDALSSIVENLTSGAGGTAAATSAAADPAATPAPTGAASTPNAPPRPEGGATAAAAPPSGGAGVGGGAGGITLSDLQGAMAGLATSTPPGSSPVAGAGAGAGMGMAGPPLSELATSDAIDTSGILSDNTVRARLVELLPEGQRTDAMLEENLRSPQVQQCLKSLTAALASGDEFNSILANFRLKPEDGAAAMASGNPIQAFLDCVLRQVEREKAAKETGEEEEGKDGGGGGEGESKMEE